MTLEKHPNGGGRIIFFILSGEINSCKVFGKIERAIKQSKELKTRPFNSTQTLKIQLELQEEVIAEHIVEMGGSKSRSKSNR